MRVSGDLCQSEKRSPYQDIKRRSHDSLIEGVRGGGGGGGGGGGYERKFTQKEPLHSE